MKEEDIRDFEQRWEVEYICDRVRQIDKAVKNGNKEKALDLLNMIKEKAASAEYFVKKLL